MAHEKDDTRVTMVTRSADDDATFTVFDPDTRLLVRLAGVVAAGTEEAMRTHIAAARHLPAIWVDEVLLQSYLFAGFPRTLNALREWRRIGGHPAPARDDDAADPANAPQWRARGEVTCAQVYGSMYDKLRDNIAALHPAIDAWMVTDGYGKLLSRPGLDLPRRELCVIAACALARQDRQLHSHLHGALNVGASPADVSATLDALDDLLDADSRTRYRLLWARIRSAHATGSA